MKKKVNLKNIFKNNLFMLKFVWQIKPSRIVFTVIVNLLNGSLNFISQIFMLRYIINAAINNISFDRVIVVAIIVVVYQCLSMFVNSYYNAIFCPICDNIIKQHFQKKLFNKALSVDLIEYDNPDFYDKFTRAISESNSRALHVVDLLGRFINCLFVLISVSLIIFIAEPILVFMAVLPFILNIVIGIKRNKIGYVQSLENTTPNRISEYVRRIFFLNNYAKEIRLSNISKVIKKKFNLAINKSIKITKDYSKKNIIIGMVMPLTNQVVVYLGTIIYTSYKTIINKTLLLADAFVIIRSIWQISSSLTELSNIMTQFHEHSIYVENVNVFLKYIPKIKSEVNSIHINDFYEDIKFMNVSFKYHQQEKCVLKNINLSIHKGEKIAIVGHNGSGKTTLIKLLLRLYDLTDGKIEIDGIDIRRYNVEQYRNIFSTIFQDYKNFAVSILDNILCGNDYNKLNVAKALKISGLDKKIKSMRFGVNTCLTKEFDEAGENFSGGEQQKLALTRAFAKNSPIIIMDEPSSSLDPIAEYEFFNNIINICKNKTVIYISHRLSSVVLSDRIIMMENGRIIEEGTHRELMDKRGKYADFFKKQAESYMGERTYEIN